jgi:hypothetical protein
MHRKKKTNHRSKNADDMRNSPGHYTWVMALGLIVLYRRSNKLVQYLICIGIRHKKKDIVLSWLSREYCGLMKRSTVYIPKENKSPVQKTTMKCRILLDILLRIGLWVLYNSKENPTNLIIIKK